MVFKQLYRTHEYKVMAFHISCLLTCVIFFMKFGADFEQASRSILMSHKKNKIKEHFNVRRVFSIIMPGG